MLLLLLVTVTITITITVTITTFYMNIRKSASLGYDRPPHANAPQLCLFVLSFLGDFPLSLISLISLCLYSFSRVSPRLLGFPISHPHRRPALAQAMLFP